MLHLTTRSECKFKFYSRNSEMRLINSTDCMADIFNLIKALLFVIKRLLSSFFKTCFNLKRKRKQWRLLTVPLIAERQAESYEDQCVKHCRSINLFLPPGFLDVRQTQPAVFQLRAITKFQNNALHFRTGIFKKKIL